MIRLFVSDELATGRRILLAPAQAHYLADVMRRSAGDEVLVFNGRDGEWRAQVSAAGRREAALEVMSRERPQTIGPDLELVAAIVKRNRLETIVEKAAELGARRVRLITTERVNAAGANLARLAAIAVEAAEQTGRLDAPAIEAPLPLARLLAEWPKDRMLMFCDEAGEAPPALDALAGRQPGAWAVLIGPEGGFSERERRLVRGHPTAVAASLGPRILRSDTAAVAALTLWQAALGDLRGP